MPKRSRKQARLPDLNRMAAGTLHALVSEHEPERPQEGKDPAAVALGRKGGLIGGKARAAAMTKKQRIASAKKAAAARWGKKG